MLSANIASQRLQRGVALIAVLWVVAFLAAIASTVAHQSRTSLQMTKNRIEQLKLKQAAESAVLLAVASKINSPGQEVGGRVGGIADNLAVTVSLIDESGKIDLNTAPVEILYSLMNEIGLDEATALSTANVILDWRDADTLVRDNGAEAANYLASGYQYVSKDADFGRVEELQLVYGMTRELYQALFPYITVHTHDYGVNLSAASTLVRRAVENASALLTSELQSGELDEEDEFISVTDGYIYTVSAQAQNKSGMKYKLSAIIRIDRGNVYEPFTVLSWQ